MKILIADDEKIKRVTLAHDLESHGHEVVTAADGAEALERLDSASFDVVVTDLKMPKVDGIELLRRIKQNGAAGTEVIIMTAYGSIPLAVEASKLGALEFLTKPFRNEDLLTLVARIEARRPPPAAAGTIHESGAPIDEVVVGTSHAIARVRRSVEVCAQSDANVLICGETGVGKDLLAGVIHRHSSRQGCPFVKVGCTLLPSQLIESELFGHERGAFTGAEQRRPGRFELAQGGTLYLDDVDDIPLEHQAKLLRAIEDKVFERVGGTASIRADVRIVASTKRNLLEKITRGDFRKDLYYRLDVLHVNVPPLRDRREDIVPLAGHLLKRIAADCPCDVEPQALEVLAEHDWPGNIRELFHVLQRVYLVGAGAVTRNLLAAEMKEAVHRRPPPSGPFHSTLERTERDLLCAALSATRGNKTAAATALGIKPSTFRDKLAKHGLG